MKISYIVPNCTADKMLINMIESYLRTQVIDDKREFIIVNNGSPKNTTNYLIKELSKFESVKNVSFALYDVPENLGYPAAVNTGFSMATGEILISVNTDIIFTKYIEEEIVKSFNKDPKIAVVGGRYIYPDAKIQHGGIFRVKDAIFFHTDWHKPYLEAFESSIPRYPIAVTGAFFCIKREYMNKYGMLDHKYWLAYDDTAYCIDVWKNGYKVYYNPDIELIHLEGATRGGSDEAKMKINKIWMDKEKESKALFEHNFKRIDINKIESNIDVENKEFKIKMLECLDENYGHLGIKRTAARGDVLLTTGIIKKIAELYPHIEINVLTNCADVFNNNPYVTEVTEIGEFLHCNYLIDLDLQYEKNPKMHIIDAYQLKFFGEKKYSLDELTPCVYSKNYNYEKANYVMPNFKDIKYIAIHPATTWENRMISKETWNTLAKKLINAGYNIVILGSKADIELTEHKKIYDLRGLLTLQDCKCILESAQMFIGVDSLIMHIAESVRIKSVVVFTCVDPQYRVIRTNPIVPGDSRCRFCLHENKPPVTYCVCNHKNKLECVKSIKWEMIYDKAQVILKGVQESYQKEEK